MRGSIESHQEEGKEIKQRKAMWFGDDAQKAGIKRISEWGCLPRDGGSFTQPIGFVDFFGQGFATSCLVSRPEASLNELRGRAYTYHHHAQLDLTLNQGSKARRTLFYVLCFLPFNYKRHFYPHLLYSPVSDFCRCFSYFSYSSYFSCFPSSRHIPKSCWSFYPILLFDASWASSIVKLANW